MLVNYLEGIIEDLERKHKEYKEQRKLLLHEVRWLEKKIDYKYLRVETNVNEILEQIQFYEKQMKYCKSAIRSLKRVINLDY